MAVQYVTAWAHRAMRAERAVLVASRLHAAGGAAQSADAVRGDGSPAQRLAGADHRRILEAIENHAAGLAAWPASRWRGLY